MYSYMETHEHVYAHVYTHKTCVYTQICVYYTHLSASLQIYLDTNCLAAEVALRAPFATKPAQTFAWAAFRLKHDYLIPDPAAYVDGEQAPIQAMDLVFPSCTCLYRGRDSAKNCLCRPQAFHEDISLQCVAISGHCLMDELLANTHVPL